MKLKHLSIALAATSLLWACNRNGIEYDASGTFEADEIIVSSEITGKLLSFNIFLDDSETLFHM